MDNPSLTDRYHFAIALAEHARRLAVDARGGPGALEARQPMDYVAHLRAAMAGIALVPKNS
jgi:hypothetical protein